MKIKEDLHRLIDSIGDEQKLKSFYRLLLLMSRSPTQHDWARENENRQELKEAYEESLNNSLLMDYDRIRYEQRKDLERD